MKKAFILLLVIASLFWSWQSFWPHYSREPALEAWMLNVGQGESVLVREPTGKKLLFDGGPDDTVLNELGSVMPPWDKKLDLVILSHNHSDHIRGLISVLHRYTVNEVWVSGATANTPDYRVWAAEISHLATHIVYAPFHESFGEAELQVYHPLGNMTGTQPSQQHDATVSVKATYSGHSIFLTGDLNTEHEAAMIQQCRPPNCSLAADVLQVPHHGSATGLTPEFLAAVHPLYALIPVGLDNKFGHPRPAIIQELQSAHIPIYRTDQNGRIHLIITQAALSVHTAASGPQ